MMKVFEEEKTGTDGMVYWVRYLVTEEELAAMQAAGLIGDVCELVELQLVADEVLESLMAPLSEELLQAASDKVIYEKYGGLIQ